MWDLDTLRKLNGNPGTLSQTGEEQVVRLLREVGLTDADVVKLQPHKILLQRFVNAIRRKS